MYGPAVIFITDSDLFYEFHENMQTNKKPNNQTENIQNVKFV